MTETPMRVGLVACSARKLPHRAPARELYVSQLFRKASAYAELTCDRWYILSAKHGLVHPATVIDPYDLRLGTKGSQPVRQWSDRVRQQLVDELEGANVRLIALAGVQYRTALHGAPWQFEVPMEGLGIGQQLGWLTRKLAAARGIE